MGFTELLFGSDEVHFDIDIETGQVIDLYIWADTAPEYYVESIDDFLPIADASWKSRINTLFRHCPPGKRKKAIERLLTSYDFETFSVSEEDEANERSIIAKMLRYYKFTGNIFWRHTDGY